MSRIIGYFLLTRGRKPQVNQARPGWRLPRTSEARRQVNAIKQIARAKEVKVVWAFDYHRNVRRLAQLPQLESLLDKAKVAGAKVVMDDTSRLFRSQDLNARAALLADLKPYFNHIVDLRLGLPLSNVPLGLMDTMVVRARPFALKDERPSRRPAGLDVEERQDQTRSARASSAISREKRAQAQSEAIAALRDEMTGSTGKPTYQSIADLANERGMTTSRGNSWTARAVGDALRRLELEASALEAGGA